MLINTLARRNEKLRLEEIPTLSLTLIPTTQPRSNFGRTCRLLLLLLLQTSLRLLSLASSLKRHTRSTRLRGWLEERHLLLSSTSPGLVRLSVRTFRRLQ